jgi:outer membrane protein
MRKTTLFAALAAATMFSTPALAGNPEGRWQVKLLGTAVLVDGKITTIDKDLIPLPAGSQTDINDNVVPTVAIEYFATPNVSVETICCLTQHHASGRGAIAGAEVVDHIMILPATVTLKYHLTTGNGFKPYVGVGPSVFFFIDEKPGATARALGATRTHLDNRVGVALQAGFDLPVNDKGLGISLDAKKYFMKTKAHFYTATGTEALATVHKLDPWVLSAGVSYRF